MPDGFGWLFTISATRESAAATSGSLKFPGFTERAGHVVRPHEEAVDALHVEDRLDRVDRAPVLDLHDQDRVFRHAVAIGVELEPKTLRPGEPNAAQSLRRIVDRVARALSFLARLDHRNDDAVGAGVHRALDQKRIVGADPHQDREPGEVRNLDRLEELAGRDRRVLHVDDDELETGARDDLGRLRIAELDP